jgi:YegS/Rv2252/BmrU family lipid kinase
MPVLIIINHAAAKARSVWPTIQEQLCSAGVQYESYETKCAGDATIRTRAAIKSGITTVAVVGGDGTLSEAVEGFFEFDSDLTKPPKAVNADAVLAVLPAGTGDDFARSLRGKRVDRSVWVEALIQHLNEIGGNEKPIDLLYGLSDGYQRPFICLNASTMGIGGETAKRVQSQGSFMRNFSGEFRFLYAALGSLAGWRERRVRVTLDQRELIDGPMNLVAVLNALYAGGGMMFSPEAAIDDGLLDVLTASGLSRFEVVRELTRIHNGGHMANPKVSVKTGRIVKIETFMAHDAMPIEADGNPRGETPVQFQVLPAALRFVG